MSVIIWLGLFTLAYFLVRRLKDSAKGKLPPSPRGYPIVGNAFQLGRTPWLPLTKWKEELGPIYSLNLAGQTAIVLSNHKTASELLDKRSAIYSDRPPMVMPGEILSGNLFIPFNHYDDSWRKLRKAAFEGLNSRAAQTYYPYHEREAAILVQALSQDSEDWLKHLNRAVKSTMVSISYASPPIESEDDPVVSYIDHFMHRIENASRPGAYLVDTFPFLNLLPSALAKWKREGLAIHEEDSKMFFKFYREAVIRADAGRCGPCLSTLLMKNSELSEREAAWTAGTMFAAGASTSAGVQRVCVLAMTLFPQAMRKAQAEIDRIVGRSRMPCASDRPKLIYLQALIRETFRWRGISPLGLPHFTTEDDVYEGYLIPKKSIVFFNLWALARDPEVFPDYDVFRPERFLDETETKENLPPYTHNEGYTDFGYGRRKCIGHGLANDIIFQNIASLLWAFDIQKAKDSRGMEIIPDANDFEDEGAIIVPAPFPCVFVPRSPEVVHVAAEVLRATQDVHLGV